jgi:hypothetical protein
VAAYQETLNLRIALCFNNYYGLLGQYSTITCENVTFNQGTQLAYNASTPSTFSLTNCLVTGFSHTNATLLLTNGVSVGCYGNYVGFYLLSGSKIISEGTPTTLNQLVRYRTVQESPISLSEPWSHTISCHWAEQPSGKSMSVCTRSSGIRHRLPTGRGDHPDICPGPSSSRHLLPQSLGTTAMWRCSTLFLGS